MRKRAPDFGEDTGRPIRFSISCGSTRIELFRVSALAARRVKEREGDAEAPEVCSVVLRRAVDSGRPIT